MWPPRMAAIRYSYTATLLPNGKVLVAGGDDGSRLASAELYDPVANTWSPAGSLATARSDHTATLLPNGKVLVAGGDIADSIYRNDAEVLPDPRLHVNLSLKSSAAARKRNNLFLLRLGRTKPTHSIPVSSCSR